MVFQQFNLFPHMTIKKNIMLSPMWVRKWAKSKVEKKSARFARARWHS